MQALCWTYLRMLMLLSMASLHAAAGQGKEHNSVDWLITDEMKPAQCIERLDQSEIVLTNGLVRRLFRTEPNFATIELSNLMTDTSVLRAVKPEAVLVVNGDRIEVGGLKGQRNLAYLDPAWLPELTNDPASMQFTGYEIGAPQARYPWEPARHAENRPWPPKGVTLAVSFCAPEDAPPSVRGLEVVVHYALFDGIPALAKWITVRNAGQDEIVIDKLEGEVLAVTEDEKPRLHVESDFAFSGCKTTEWGPDKEYTSQVDFQLRMPLLLKSTYPLGPGIHLAPGEEFESFRTLEILQDSDDRERRGLARRRVYRTLAPQVTENPILMHVRKSDSEALRLAIDQCAEVGFEMVIMTFGSGFDIESEDPEYIARIKADADYAHEKGIEIGGYTLMCASRDISPEVNCISPETGLPAAAEKDWDQSACLATEWADGYFARVLNLMDQTGLDLIETDGPFHGDVCASTTHKHHRGTEDSKVAQWRACCGFYHACRARGIYINTPDWYFFNGSNKCAMGYREDNWSLPRAEQIILGRQNIFDGTFVKTPSMGWMFVPLVEYHGGGEAATLEPLSEHLAEYEWHLAQNFGSGVQACYRGPRLYDTDETKAVVKKWVDFHRRHRAILDSDIIHVRRADGRAVDCMLHVNHRLKERGLAMVYNPAKEAREMTLTLPLYYTGLTDSAHIRIQDGAAETYPLDRAYQVHVPLAMEPWSCTWVTIEE